MTDEVDTITRCPVCRKLVGARKVEGRWRTNQHADRQGQPYCDGGGAITR